MSTPTKSFIAVDPNSGATYRFNETDWQEKKDRFVSKYPDAEIMEYDAYNPEDTQENDNIFIATDNGAYSFSPDEWTEKGDRFMTKHPEASVSRVRTVNYWGDKAAEQEQAIKAKREAMQAIPQDATELWGNNPEYLRDLSELEEMEKAYKENPYVIAKAEAEKSSLRKLKEATENDYAAFMKEYEDVVAGGGNRVMFGGSEDAMMEGFARSLGAAVRGEDLGRQVEYDTQKPLFDAALQNISDAEDILDKPNQSENNGNAVANVFKGIGARYGSAEFWSRGMTKLVALNNGGNEAIEKINRKLQSAGDGITEEDIDKILSPAEKAYVFSLMEVANAQAQRAPMDTLPDYVNAERKVSRAYQIGEGIAEMTGFIAEFIATGSITDAATSGATKVVQGWLIKNLMAKGGKALAQKAARGLSKVAVNALTKTASAAMKSAVRTTAMGATGGLGGNIATQRTTLQEDGTFKGTGESILGGTYETAVENFTEEMGPVITDLLGAPFKPLAKPIKDYLKGIDYSDFGKLESMAKKVGYVFDKSTPMAKALAKGGYHGTVEEYGEELLGALIRGEMDEFFDKDQQLVLIGTFAPMAALGMGGSAAHVIRSTKEVKAAAENLRLKLKESGIDDKQIDYLTDYVRSTSAEKMGKEFSPLIGRMAQESGLGQSFYTSDTYKAVARYIKAVAEYQTIDSQHKEQEGQQRADKQAELEEKYGKFYNQSDNTVNVVQLKDGRVVYQVTDFAESGEAGAVDMNDGKPITFRAEDVQTYTDKEGKTHNQESGKMSLDSYLSSEIMKRKESAQTARMREERQMQINELAQSLPKSFDLGTESDPYNVVVKSHDANGVTVVDEKGDEMTLAWDKIGRLMKKPIKVLTDAQIAEAEAAEMALRVESVRAKNAKTESEAQQVEKDTASIDEEVKSLQPNPEDLYTDKETGEVDEVEFWKNDPEGYCEWNDKRQQDGGIDSMKQIANARAALEGVIKKAEKEAKTDNPVTRRTAEGILFTAKQQLETYAAIEKQYAERNSTQEEKRAEEVIAMRERISFWRERLNLGDNLVVLESLDEVKSPMARRAISLGRTEGWYDTKEKKVYLYLPDIASTRVLDKKVMHEIVTHYGLDHFLGEAEYAKLTDMVWNIMSDSAKRNFYNYTGVSDISDPVMRRRRAAEEFIAKVAEDVNIDNANAESRSIWQRIVDFFKKLFEKDEINLAANEIAEALNKNIKGLVVGNEKIVEEFKEEAKATQPKVDTQVEAILNESGLSVMEDLAENVMAQAETMTNEEGLPITSNTNDGTELFSTTTAKPWVDNLGNEHKGTMEMVLERMQQMEFSEQEIRQMEAKMQTAYDYMMKLQSLTNPDGSVRFEEFNAWAEKTPLYKQVGRDFVKAITSLVSNGDYPINLELTTDCIKREAFTMLLNELVKRGADLAGMGPAEIVTIQKMMKQYGIQVACALCFVEGKRLQIVNWASQIVNDWNDALIEAGVETDEMFEFGKDGDAFIPSEEWRTYEDKPKLAKALRTIDEVARIFQGVDPKVYKAQKAKNEKALKKYIKEKEEVAAKKGKKWTPTDEQKREMKKIKVAGLTPTYVNENMKEYTAAFEQMRNEWVAKSPKKGPMRDPLDFTPTKTQWDELEKIRNRQIENVKQKMVRLIMEYPEMRKKMTLNDLLGSKGLMEIRQQHGVAYEQLYSIILQRFGTGTPKPVQDAVPYDGEVMTLTESAFKAANKIGGARLFSFSDFDITKVFDYMQMFFDLEANRQMLQSYTKEVAAVLLFGKSNAKFNISTLASAVVPAKVLEEYEKASEGKRKDMRHQWAENAGLIVDENGNITGISFSEEHSVSPEFAQQIFHDDTRNKDCGAIMVGASVNHAIYSAAQAWIRMVIPFHLSGMPIAARDKTDVKWWTDNTEYQSTRKKTKDGWSKISDKENTFEFYADMHQEGWNMRDKAREYLEWCKSNAFRPKFDWGINSDYYRAYCEENGYTPNQQIIDMMDADTTNGVWNQYYKFLTDFTAYKPVFNEEGEMIDEIPSPQQRVISNFDMSEMEKQVIFEGENSMLARREGNIALANQHVSELADKVTPYLNGQITEEEMGLRDDVFYDARKDANAYLEAKGNLMFSTEIVEVNKKFNQRLAELEADPNQKDKILHLGRPSVFLMRGGVRDAEILLEYDKFVRKSAKSYKSNHPFTAADIENLPLAIYAPIASFDSTSGKEQVILTELKKDGNNFVVIVRATRHPRKGGAILEVNDIQTLYPKNAKGIVNWILTGKTTQVDTEKALDWIGALQTHLGTELSQQELSNAAKVIKEFNNPNLMITKEQDAEYKKAVEAGDMETAQRMVIEAAKLAMPNTKVVDEDGNPRIVYHQTNAKVYVNRETGQNWDDLNWREKMEWDERDDWEDYWEEQDFNKFSRVNARTTNEFDGFFFAPNYDEYHEYGERTIAAFVNIQNPASSEDYNIDSTYNDAGRNERIRLQEMGFDGVIRLDGEEVDEYIAFEPSQIKSADAVTYDNDGNVIPLSERFNPKNEDIRFSTSNRNQRIFVSNAAKAVEGIKQDKATPEQWLKMIEKNGGLKAGEDKWMGLSDWLKASDKKTLTKQEVLDFINENMIVIEEQHYGVNLMEDREDALHDNMIKTYGQDFYNRFVGDAFIFEDSLYGGDWHLSIQFDDTAADLYNEYNEDKVDYNEDEGGLSIQDKEKVRKWATAVAREMEAVDEVRQINPTRKKYSTGGLRNHHEIALTIPTIESWNKGDDVHFGDAGEGRAVAWVRFGETYSENTNSEVNEYLKEKYGKEDFEAGNFTEEDWDKLRGARKQGKKVLVIDEIQSKRHQEGREKGYSSDFDNSAKLQELNAELEQKIARRKELNDYFDSREENELVRLAQIDMELDEVRNVRDYDRLVAERDEINKSEENALAEFDMIVAQINALEYDIRREEMSNDIKKQTAIPDAPFEKNWHELAMKRMLRYAAENGYDVVAWTKGEQQAERYGIGKVVSSVGYRRTEDGKRVRVNLRGGESLLFDVDVLGKVTEVHRGDMISKGMSLSEIVGADLAKQIDNYEGEVDERGDYNIKSENFRIGGEGMKGFYDKMLPAFMNKYGKKWGIKVEDIELPNLEEAGQVMHSVPVTQEMKESVMEGQLMFSTKSATFESAITPEVRKEMDVISAQAFVNGNYLLAPNGKDSKLTPEQWALVRTKNFLNWFGDWINDPENASKVVDENGEPMVVYHGTRQGDFTVFDTTKANKERSYTYDGIHYFTESETTANTYGDTKAVFLNIRNPYEYDFEGRSWRNDDWSGIGIMHRRSSEIIKEGFPSVEEAEKYLADFLEEHPEYKDEEGYGAEVVTGMYVGSKGDHTDELANKARANGYDGTIFDNVIDYETYDESQRDELLKPHKSFVVFSPNQIKSATENNGEYSKSEDIRFSTDSNGKKLTPSQQEFFANSKAVDKDGNLLVLYHGTPRAGFTEFESGWFTTSKEDAISYSGDRKGRLFDPNEEYVPETLTAGDFPLGYMTFDSEEDRAAFLAEHPTAESALSESEYENARMQAEDEEYDALTERKPELQEIWDAYREYERDHFVDTTIGEILNNPDAYTEDDLRRAVLAYDSNAVFDSIDELETTEERKSELVDSLNYMNEDAKENGADGILDIMVATRVPRNGEGIKHNDTGNRTYEVYANIERPYEIDAEGRHSEFESGDIYKAVESALKDDNYDGIIIRNWRVGRHQQVGDVVVPKNGSQVKLTSNENPTESNDILFSTRQPYESAKAFIQTETDKFYETYNTTLPAKVVYANSRKMIAEALGYKVEEMPDALYKAIREEAKKGYACVVSIDNKPTAIIVFPREDVNQTAKVSRILFHENTHPMISDKPELLDLGKWLIENPKGIAEGVAEQVKSQYAEEDWSEEMVCDYIGAMLSLGRSQEALDSVPEEYKPLLNYVYERFGYKPEDEDPRRRSERLADARELQMRNSENEESNAGDATGGELFSTAGREKSVEEIVEEGKQKVSAEHTQTVDAFMDRIRRINGNLQQLRMAAAAQREYDQKTVKTITDIANDLLEGGALNDLTRGEIKRLLSIINGGVGKSDLTKSVNRLMDLMIANQLRYGKSLIEKFLKIRGSKVDQRGVEVRGTLDIPGQQMLAAFKEGIGLSKEKLADRIADAEDALSSESETKRRNAENELVGLYLAKQYHEDINDSIEEEKDLRNEIKKADEDYKAGKITKEMHKQLLDTIYEAILENRIQRVNAYEKLASDLGAKMVSSIKNAGLLRDAEKERVQKIQHFANSDMQGMPADMHGVKENRFWNSPLVRFFLKPLATFDQMLRSFAPKSTSGEGYLWNHFMGGWTKATESEYKGVQEAHEMLDSAARTMFGEGVERWSDLFAKERKMPKITIKVWDNGEMVDKEISQGNALYIYMVNKMTDGKMKLRKMGISQEDVDAIVAQMDPRFITLADWMQERFLPSLRDKYNTVHERLFGAPMASIDNYFPIKVNPGARTREVDVEAGEGTAKPATITGSIIKRTKNSLALDIMNADAFDVMLEHIQQMEHWAAFAEFNKDLNTLLSYRKFRNRVENMSGIYGSGKTVWSNFKTVAEIAAGVYQPASKSDSLDKTALNVAKGVTGAKISFRVYTAIKQLLSMPAFVSDANIVTLAKNIATPWIAWNWAMENLPMFEKRWKSRQAGDTRLMQTDSDWKIWKYKIVELAGRYGMTPNAFIDAVTVSIGARSIYETKYQSYLDMGYSEEQADKKAKQDATVLFNESQQSNESAFLSAVQVDRTVASVAFTVFRNSAMGYQRMAVDAWRNISHMMRKGYKEESIEYMKKQMVRDGLTEEQAERAATRVYNRSFAKNAARLVTFQFLVQFAWNLGAYLPYLLVGDDDDEKKAMVKDAAIRGLVGGPIEGMAGGSIISNMAGNLAMGEKLSDVNTTLLPVISDIEKTIKMLDYDKVAAYNEMFNILIQSGIGVNPQTFTDIIVAIEDACNGEPQTSKEVALCIMRALQVPQSQLEKVYFDEIDFTVDKGLDLTIEEFAKRYANYKVNRGTPLTGWMYEDEVEKEREDKYIKRFLKTAKELKRSRGNEEAKKYYEYLDTDYKETTETINDLKRKAKESAMKGDQVGAMEYAKMLRDFMETDLFKDYVKFGGKAKAIESIRDKMKKVDLQTRESLEETMLELRKDMVEEMEKANL